MKKRMRRVSILLLTVLLVSFLFPMSVRADVIYEPWDSFYEEHRGECVYVSRSYIASGPNGDVTVYESPESDWKEKTISNGETLWISYTYEDADGIVWGCWESWEEDLIGWVPMDYLVVIYDGISFEEEYGDRFVSEEGMLDEAYLGQTIYFWQYPGSDVNHWITLSGDSSVYRPEYSSVYTDADGARWGRCGYYMGIRDYWINLDNPTADYAALYPEGPAETEPVTGPTQPREEAVAEIVPKESNSLKIAAIAAVIAVIAVTVVLLYLLKKKN